jgi:ankyrin repeat and BTB/POZ domain-containing protein 1
MSEAGLLRKDQLELSLHEEKKLIEDGVLKEDNPLDVTDNFRKLCEACRRGDLKVCQEMITEGVNINARDSFDYTPLILVGLIAILPLPFGEPGQAAPACGEARW